MKTTTSQKKISCHPYIEMSGNWSRALVSSAVYAGVAWAITGGSMSLEALAVNAAVQTGSALGSDLLHNASGVAHSAISDAVVTGGLHTAIQWVHGDRDGWMMNYAASAGSQFVGASVADTWSASVASGPAPAPSGSAMESVATLEPVAA